MKPKKYKIDSLEKICDIVNENNFRYLATDFINWLNTYLNLVTLIKQKRPELKNKKNTEIAKGYFEWIDDGKCNNLGIKIH